MHKALFFTGIHLFLMAYVAWLLVTDYTVFWMPCLEKKSYYLQCSWSDSSSTFKENEKEFDFSLIYFTCFCLSSLNGILMWFTGILFMCILDFIHEFPPSFKIKESKDPSINHLSKDELGILFFQNK